MPPPRKKAEAQQPKQAPKRPPDESEMVPIDYNRLRLITSVVQIDTVNLVESTMASFLDARLLDTGELGEGTFEYGVQLSDAAWARKGQRVDVSVGYVIRARIHGESSKELFRVSARFLVGYRVPKDFEIDAAMRADAMADFVMANGQMNAFPYVRQLVADQTARAGWPALQLSVLRAPAKRRRDFVRERRFGELPHATPPKSDQLALGM